MEYNQYAGNQLGVSGSAYWVFFCVAESLRLIFTGEEITGKKRHTIVGMLIRWGKENRGEVHERDIY